MKKFNKVICVIIIAVMTLSAVFSASALEGGIEEKEVVTYLYGPDDTTTLTCLFVEGYPKLPYVDVLDYLSYAFINGFMMMKNGDGTFTISCENRDADVKFDVEKDTVTFRNFETFVMIDPYLGDSDLGSYAVQYLNEIYYVDEPELFTLDLSEYNFDIIEYNGNVYLPFNLYGIIFCSMNNLTYVDGALYFVQSFSDFYYDRAPIQDQVDRDPEMISVTYDQLCLCLDHYYGRPGHAIISDFLNEMSFDEFLENTSDYTKHIKELLLSDSMCDFLLGFSLLEYYVFDCGHSAYTIDFVDVFTQYPESALGQLLIQNYNNPPDEYWQDLVSLFNDLTASGFKNLKVSMSPA